MTSVNLNIACEILDYIIFNELQFGKLFDTFFDLIGVDFLYEFFEYDIEIAFSKVEESGLSLDRKGQNRRGINFLKFIECVHQSTVSSYSQYVVELCLLFYKGKGIRKLILLVDEAIKLKAWVELGQSFYRIVRDVDRLLIVDSVSKDLTDNQYPFYLNLAFYSFYLILFVFYIALSILYAFFVILFSFILLIYLHWSLCSLFPKKIIYLHRKLRYSYRSAQLDIVYQSLIY